MALAEEISVLPRIDSVVWFLIVTLMQINIEKEQTEKGKNTNYTDWEAKEHQEV